MFHRCLPDVESGCIENVAYAAFAGAGTRLIMSVQSHDCLSVGCSGRLLYCFACIIVG